jgi:hypothetical protein
MTFRARRVFLAVVICAWLVLAWLGLSGGVREFPDATTPGQKAQTTAQFAYGVFALATLVTTFRARKLARLTRWGWLVSITLAAGLAPVFWGDTGWGPGVVAGVAALGIGALLLWCLDLTSRERPEPVDAVR